jgi:hypothetical protein
VEEMRQDKWLYLKFSLAESLGKTYRELNEMMTDEEIILWSAYHQVKQEKEAKAIERAKRGR